MSVGGVFHTGVEVGDVEWGYGYCDNGTGVYRVKPRTNPMYRYREAVPLGLTKLEPPMVKKVLLRLTEEWKGRDYDLLNRNCNHFAAALVAELGVGPMPAWINRSEWRRRKRKEEEKKEKRDVLVCTQVYKRILGWQHWEVVL